MDAEFRAELNAVVHGRYQVTGESRIAVDGAHARGAVGQFDLRLLPALVAVRPRRRRS